MLCLPVYGGGVRGAIKRAEGAVVEICDRKVVRSGAEVDVPEVV